MSLLRCKLDQLFEEALVKHSIKKTPLLLDASIDPAHFRNSMTGKRPFSDSMLEALAASKYLDTSLKVLKAFRAIDEYGFDVLCEAIKFREEEIRNVELTETQDAAEEQETTNTERIE